jgi:hypothetical protein
MVVRHSIPGLLGLPLTHPIADQFGSGEPELSHFVGRFDPKQRQPRSENGDNPLHQGEPRRSCFWIILDNEA